MLALAASLALVAAIQTWRNFSLSAELRRAERERDILRASVTDLEARNRNQEKVLTDIAGGMKKAAAGASIDQPGKIRTEDPD